MSHLTPAQIKHVGMIIDSAITYVQIADIPDKKQISIFLMGIKLFLPMFNLEDAEDCAQRYYQEGRVTLEERDKIGSLKGLLHGN